MRSSDHAAPTGRPRTAMDAGATIEGAQDVGAPTSSSDVREAAAVNEPAGAEAPRSGHHARLPWECCRKGGNGRGEWKGERKRNRQSGSQLVICGAEGRTAPEGGEDGKTTSRGTESASRDLGPTSFCTRSPIHRSGAMNRPSTIRLVSDIVVVVGLDVMVGQALASPSNTCGGWAPVLSTCVEDRFRVVRPQLVHQRKWLAIWAD